MVKPILITKIYLKVIDVKNQYNSHQCNTETLHIKILMTMLKQHCFMHFLLINKPS